MYFHNPNCKFTAFGFTLPLSAPNPSILAHVQYNIQLHHHRYRRIKICVSIVSTMCITSNLAYASSAHHKIHIIFAECALHRIIIIVKAIAASSAAMQVSVVERKFHFHLPLFELMKIDEQHTHTYLFTVSHIQHTFISAQRYHIWTLEEYMGSHQVKKKTTKSST